MKEQFKRFLSENEYLPIESDTWNKFVIEHKLDLDNSIRTQVKRDITKQVGKRNGIYIYKSHSDILYVGQGNLSSRLRDHYNESHKLQYPKKNEKWYKFFSQHIGVLNVYWVEIKNKQERVAIEAMLTRVLEPKFLTYLDK